MLIAIITLNPQEINCRTRMMTLDDLNTDPPQNITRELTYSTTKVVEQLGGEAKPLTLDTVGCKYQLDHSLAV